MSFFIVIFSYMKRIMGWDVSSATVGWCVLDVDEDGKNVKFIKCSYFKPIKKGSTLDRLKHTQDKVQSILEEYKPDEIAIEEITKFMPHLSSAQTIITLAIFNRVVGLTCLNYLKKSPEMFSVMAMRHGLKLTSELPKKEDMPSLVETYMNIKFPFEINKNGKIKNESYDMADACIVGMYYAFKLSHRLDSIKRARDLLK